MQIFHLVILDLKVTNMAISWKKKSVLISFFQDLLIFTKSMEHNSFLDADCRSMGASQSFHVQRLYSLFNEIQ